MIGEADGEPLTRLTSTGIPPPPINLRCGLTLGEGEDGEEGDGKEGRRWTDVEKEEMGDRVKEACDLEVKSQIFGEIKLHFLCSSRRSLDPERCLRNA